MARITLQDMSDPRVIIVGCGIAGPVLALLLHEKGYKPTVVEKVKKLGDVGGSLMLQPNGLKVLNLIGLSKKALTGKAPAQQFRDMTSTGETLGTSDLPSTFVRRYGQPAAGVPRAELNLGLKEELFRKGIPLHEGWRLQSIEETETGVAAISVDGQRIEGAFLVGCDGLRGKSRELLLKRKGVSQEAAAFTGLTQQGAFSPTPASLRGPSAMVNFYGPGAHVIMYQLTEELSAWAITSPDEEAASESWQSYSAHELPKQKKALLQEFDAWCDPVKELIAGAQKLMKFGLYDRPGLTPEQWYDGRCVLIGDAAHPTSPHLGQGANQAFEDCYHLTQLLPDFNDISSTPISTEALTQIFAAFAEKRQPRTAALVKGARAQGERRVVVGGPAACKERDELIRQQWIDEAALEARFDALLKEPFP